MRIVKGVILGLAVYIFVGFFGHLIWEDAKAINAQTIQSLQGISVRTTGVVTVDKWVCYDSNTILPPNIPGAPPRFITNKHCPTRIEFAIDVPPDLLLCMTTEMGQTCKKLVDVFSK